MTSNFRPAEKHSIFELMGCLCEVWVDTTKVLIWSLATLQQGHFNDKKIVKLSKKKNVLM